MGIPGNRAKRWLALGSGSLVLAIAIHFLRSSTLDQPATTSAPPSLPLAPRPVDQATRAARPGERQRPPEPHTARETDFPTTMHAAIRHGEELGDQRELFELGYRWVAADPEKALDFVLSLPFDHTLLLVALTGEWARRDAAAAGAWAVRLPDRAYRDRVLASLVAIWAENAPAEATRFANNLAPANVRNEALVAALSGWAQHDPPAALEWAGQFVQGRQQEQIYTQVVYTWARQDPVSAAEWLRSAPDGKTWDSAVSALCGVLVERHPALALSLAANISDDTLRVQRIENVARRWLEHDRASAETALIHSDLPAPLVSRLLR